MVRSIAIVAVLASALAAASPAHAKEAPVAFLVCGQERCVDAGPAALRHAATLTWHGRRAPQDARPFYEMTLVWREPGGGLSAGGTLRYVPSLRATRSTRGAAEDPLWFRATPGLTRRLAAAIAGLAPRPASALDDPAAAVGAPTRAAVRRAVAPGMDPALADGVRPLSLEVLALVALLAALLARPAHGILHRPWRPHTSH